MAKQLLNEAERYLVEHWAEAAQLEEAMKDVRTKYSELGEKIINAVKDAHADVDATAYALTQPWSSGQIAIGRKSWPGAENNKPRWLASGIWLLHLKLETLMDEDDEEPTAFIQVTKKSNLDFEAARAALRVAAKSQLSADEFKCTREETTGEQLLFLPAPSKRQLVDALLAPGDGQAFVDVLVAQLQVMARFIPVLDKVFAECVKAK